ncbi:virulence RhuM family protein [Avibacterium avium]|uniref:virulence RhuM family protein n=1 Tax=Avibacterium avium TaxID=751 RepID=UPI003BF859EC
MGLEQKFLLYTSDNGQTNINVFLENDSLWVTQKDLSTLFDVSKSTISEHLKNIFATGELAQNATVRKIRIVQNEGQRQVAREMDYYNLDVIISVGYRVNSAKATQFRIWATQVLREFIIKGFVLDEERLKLNRNLFNADHFKELLEKVRSIRASERRIWQQVTDIFKECSIDYDKDSTITKQFYATVQNKFHYAITGQTAPEIVYSKANRKAENMGLTTWKNAPDGRILYSDTKVAKNYLSEREIRQLERAVSGYFDYIEGVIERKNPTDFTMEKLAESVNKFLAFNDYEILEHKGTVTREDANKKAKSEYEEFNRTQKIISDFDKQIKKLTNS